MPDPCSLEDGWSPELAVAPAVGWDVQMTAAYLAPRVVPWWRAPRPEPRLLNVPGTLLRSCLHMIWGLMLG